MKMQVVQTFQMDLHVPVMMASLEMKHSVKVSIL